MPLGECRVSLHEFFDACHSGVVVVIDAPLEYHLVLFFVVLVVILLLVRVVSVAVDVGVTTIFVVRVNFVFGVVCCVIVFRCCQSAHFSSVIHTVWLI